MIRYKSYAKINLSLEILSKREDGYHNIDSIMSRISLHDIMEYRQIPGGQLVITSDDPDVPTDESNLVHKAWSILKDHYSGDPGMEIHIQKRIPMGSGLGGGTSNGVLTMEVLNQIWDLNIPRAELEYISRPLGADSTFFYTDGIVRVQGIGEQTRYIGPTPNMYLVLIDNGKSLSSQQVYQGIREFGTGDIESTLEDSSSIGPVLDIGINTMESVAFGIYPELESIKEDIRDSGARVALMSGAGTTIFGMYDSEASRDMAFSKLKDKYHSIRKAELI